MKPALYTFTAAFLLCFGTSVSAFNQPDSLEALIKKKSGTEKIDLMLSLADYCQNSDPQKGLKVASDALRMSEELNYAKGKALSYANLGEMYMNLSDFNSALINYKKAFEIRESSGDRYGAAMSLNSIGGALEHLGKYDQAIKYYYKAIELEEKNSDKKGLSVSYSLVATLHYILQDYSRALEFCSRAMKIREKLNDQQGMANSYELMGLINYDFNKFEESLKYHFMALKVKSGLNERVGVAGSYQNLGMVYRKLKKFGPAEGYLSKALRLRMELGDKRGIAASLTSLGEIYETQGKLQAALDHFSRAFQIRQEIKDKRGITRSYFHLSSVYQKMGNYKKAFEFQNLFFTHKDSLNKAQALQKVTALDMQYKNEKKDQEIALLQKDSILEKTIRNSLIAGVLLVTIIAMGTFAAYRSKKKTYLLLEEKNREITGHHEELKRLNEELKVSHATKDKFFSIIAHDLRSPFFGFLGISGELAENSKSLTTEEISEYAGLINQSAKKIFELVNNLLEWSLIQSGRINPEPSELTLHDEVENIKDLFRSSAMNKSITFVNGVQETEKVWADKKMVETILRNLVSNAIKFTAMGGNVSISSRPMGEFLEVAVSDSGMGMKPELTEKIFKIDSVYSQKGTRGETGSGLGLVLCKELVEINGGVLSVESQPGKGTTFTFTLPSYRQQRVVSQA